MLKQSNLGAMRSSLWMWTCHMSLNYWLNIFWFNYNIIELTTINLMTSCAMLTNEVHPLRVIIENYL